MHHMKAHMIEFFPTRIDGWEAIVGCEITHGPKTMLGRVVTLNFDINDFVNILPKEMAANLHFALMNKLQSEPIPIVH